MGSDPQSHLEAQNVLIVGEKKVRQEDWRRVMRQVTEAEKELKLLGMMCEGLPRDIALGYVRMRLLNLLSFMAEGMES